MKAFLLVAGHGTRLRPLTDTIPKCLVPINGIPMLQIWLDLCARNGIDEVLLNVHTHSEIIRGFVAASQGPVKVHFAEENVLLGSAGTVRANRAWVATERNFWIFYSDVLNRVDLQGMAASHDQKQVLATIGVYRVPDPARCGIVTTNNDGIVTEFVEKPAQPKSNLAFSGIMLANPAIFEFIPDIIPADMGFHVLPRLVGLMAAYEISEYLLDIGTMPNYELAQRTWPGLLPKRESCLEQ